MLRSAVGLDVDVVPQSHRRVHADNPSLPHQWPDRLYTCHEGIMVSLPEMLQVQDPSHLKVAKLAWTHHHHCSWTTDSVIQVKLL